MPGRRIGLVRVLTTSDPELLASHGRIIQESFPDLEVVSRCIPDQPEGVHDAATAAAAAPKVVKVAAEMAREGVRAVVVSCVADPGLEEARRKLPVPVIGAGEATGLCCRAFGAKVGALGITPVVPAALAGVLGDALVASVCPEGVRTTLDLLRPAGRQATLAAAAELKRRGVEVVALACTGMSTVGLAPDIRRQAGLRVVDPVTAAGLFAWYAANNL